MSRKTWTKGNLHISYGHPLITPFYDEENEEKELKTMDDVMYFYYNISILNGNKTMLFLGTHDSPKVQDLPQYIDHIMKLGKKKMFLMDDCKQDGFHRTIRYAQIVLEDGFGFDMEYSYKIERYDYAVKQSDEKKYKKWTNYELTIGERERNEDFGKTVTVKYITPEELIALKNTALAFCEAAIHQYNNC